MGDDLVIKIMTERYSPILTKLYNEDLDKFKMLFNKTKDAMIAAAKIANGPTPEIVNRKLFLDMMSTINAVASIEHYVETSKDEIACFLRGEQISNSDDGPKEPSSIIIAK